MTTEVQSWESDLRGSSGSWVRQAKRAGRRCKPKSENRSPTGGQTGGNRQYRTRVDGGANSRFSHGGTYAHHVISPRVTASQAAHLEDPPPSASCAPTVRTIPAAGRDARIVWRSR
jgi:hypothetical protein